MSFENLLSDWKHYRKGTEEGGFHKYEHQLAMVVDLNRCIGCNACSVACYAENNLPVVGEERFAKNQAMHWMRIERFWDEPDLKAYKTDATSNVTHWYEDRVSAKRSSALPATPGPWGMPHADDNRNAPLSADGDFLTHGGSFLPFMCQQCHSATCEPVCPVAATYHTPDGLNAQVYNRCIGSRFCSNNCPYRLRFFNWYSYYEDAWPHPLELQLNPDLSVRDKGVMEKCTFCVQRVRVAKDKAKMDDRPVKDGEFTTACAQTCPTGAITFGDRQDPESKVAKAWKHYQVEPGKSKQQKQNKDLRGYRALEGLNTDPHVLYLDRVRDV